MDRPEGIPASAVLVGTAKSYVFIDCVAAKANGDYDCTVYGGLGHTIASGVFGLKNATSFNPNANGEFLAFDGSDIILSKSRRLVVHEPPRPRDVPPSAVWGGGPSCGTFLDCRPAGGGSLFECTVFHERTGQAIARGMFVLHGDAGAEFQFPQSCDAARGGRIFTAGGAYLERVD
jgi:hypothetical protein